jgi:hypothetical protein
MSQEQSLSVEVKEVFEKAVDRVNEVVGGDYEFVVNYVDVYQDVEIESNYVTVEAVVIYGTKLLEISEVVSEGLNYRLEDIERELGRELTDEELDELWNNAYNEYLEELNGEYCIYVSGEVNIPLYNVYPFYSGKLEIQISPLECDRDYCWVGSHIVLRFENVRVESFTVAKDKVLEFLVNLLNIIYGLITL